VLLGWQLFMGWMWPPKPRPPKPAEEAVVRLPYPPLWANVPAAVQTSFADPFPGLANAARLTAEVGLLANRAAAERPRPAVAKVDEPPKPIVRKKNEQVAIGNDAFNLKGTLTSRGAGVQNLTLTAFAEADRLGLPAKPPRPLELIPNDARR